MFFKKALGTTVLGLFLLFLDRWCKYAAFTTWRVPRLWVDGWVGWEPFLNPGAAFGIPVPAALIVFFTIPIIALVAVVMWREGRAGNWMVLGAGVFIMSGAVSNLFDRLVLGKTIDYFRIITGVINLADVWIIIGGLMMVLGMKRAVGKNPAENKTF